MVTPRPPPRPLPAWLDEADKGYEMKTPAGASRRRSTGEEPYEAAWAPSPYGQSTPGKDAATRDGIEGGSSVELKDKYEVMTPDASPEARKGVASIAGATALEGKVGLWSPGDQSSTKGATWISAFSSSSPAYGAAGEPSSGPSVPRSTPRPSWSTSDLALDNSLGKLVKELVSSSEEGTEATPTDMTELDPEAVDAGGNSAVRQLDFEDSAATVNLKDSLENRSTLQVETEHSPDVQVASGEALEQAKAGSGWDEVLDRVAEANRLLSTVKPLWSKDASMSGTRLPRLVDDGEPLDRGIGGPSLQQSLDSEASQLLGTAHEVAENVQRTDDDATSERSSSVSEDQTEAPSSTSKQVDEKGCRVEELKALLREECEEMVDTVRRYYSQLQNSILETTTGLGNVHKEDRLSKLLDDLKEIAQGKGWPKGALSTRAELAPTGTSSLPVKATPQLSASTAALHTPSTSRAVEQLPASTKPSNVGQGSGSSGAADSVSSVPSEDGSWQSVSGAAGWSEEIQAQMSSMGLDSPMLRSSWEKVEPGVLSTTATSSKAKGGVAWSVEGGGRAVSFGHDGAGATSAAKVVLNEQNVNTRGVKHPVHPRRKTCSDITEPDKKDWQSRTSEVDLLAARLLAKLANNVTGL